MIWNLIRNRKMKNENHQSLIDAVVTRRVLSGIVRDIRDPIHVVASISSIPNSQSPSP